MREAGFDATGVSSPWTFGVKVEHEYVAAIVTAQKIVYNRDVSWYFLHMSNGKLNRRPYVAYQDDVATLVSVPANVRDWLWGTIASPRTDEAFVSAVTDKILTADGRSGQMIEVLESGDWPIMLTHWQSLFSNGLETGLKILNELACRIEEHLADRVQWTMCSEIMRLVTT